MITVNENDHNLTFEVVVQPRARKTQVIGEWDGALKIKIQAPPVNGQANLECIRFLAQRLGVPRSDIEILFGLSNKRKTIRVQGISRQTLQAKLTSLSQPHES